MCWEDIIIERSVRTKIYWVLDGTALELPEDARRISVEIHSSGLGNSRFDVWDPVANAWRLVVTIGANTQPYSCSLVTGFYSITGKIRIRCSGGDGSFAVSAIPATKPDELCPRE